VRGWISQPWFGVLPRSQSNTLAVTGTLTTGGTAATGEKTISGVADASTLFVATPLTKEFQVALVSTHGIRMECSEYSLGTPTPFNVGEFPCPGPLR
jgi:hypothetical protein